MKSSIPLLIGMILVTTWACAPESRATESALLPEEVLVAAASITSEDYLRKISIIAHDSMGGRDTPSPGLEATATWIASEFKRLGLEPGGDNNSYIQRYEIEVVSPDLVSSSVEVSGDGYLQFGRDLISPFGVVEDDLGGGVVVLSGSGEPPPDVVEQIVGKHVIVASMAQGLDRDSRRFATNLQRNGALSVIVATDRTDQEWERSVRDFTRRTSLRIGRNSGRGGGVSLEVRDRAIEPILSAHGVDLRTARHEGGMVVLETNSLELHLSLRIEVIDRLSAPNVVGILEGSDPELKEEYVAFSAHMDHIGIGTPNAQGDTINNGADDDASGTTTVLEVVEAYASLETKPKRSMIFLLVSGEEKGLWGSEYFVENPPVPIARVVADLNADMVGRNWADTIVVIGKEHSDLGETLNTVNSAHPELGMTAIDDPWPEERFYFRSDHYNFARKGVPVLFFFSGTHDDYHGRDDEVDRIDTEKAARISRLIFYLGHEVANRVEPPRWDPESFRQIVSDP